VTGEAEPTVANWQEPDMVRTSFQRIESFLRTTPIAAGARPSPLQPAHGGLVDLAGMRVGDVTVADVLAATETDGWLVLHEGRVVAEEYVPPMTSATRHLLMSVSKSVVGITAGALVERGLIEPARPVAAYVPDLALGGYAGATVRDVLDMRTGVRFSEDYLDPRSEVRLLDQAVGWAPQTPDGPHTLDEFLRGLVAEGPHGQAFHYRSCDTDLLGRICEVAGGAPLASLVSELVWGLLGAERDASLCVDSVGAAMCDGGISATLRDLGRFGEMLRRRGVGPTGERVVSEAWVDDIFAGTDDLRAAFARSDDAELLPGGHYRSQVWVPGGGQHALCVGIHGQLVYVDRAACLVGVKLSSWPMPLDGPRMSATLAMFGAIADHLRA